MEIKKYLSKRDLKQTPEPASGSKKPSSSLRFCVQKHAARSLHYDFRLEYKGVLLSWAVPKGPSLNPQDKRLAVHVEDHPLDYQYFEGTIPKGNYGAGTVEIWDAGTFITPFSSDKKEIEKYLQKGLKEGHFAIILHGKRLNGEFIFQKLKKNDPEDHNWLLIKKGDEHASSNNSSETKKETLTSEKKKKSSKMPSFIKPMLATLVDEAFNSPEWLFEIKWDGFRALAFIKDGKATLKSRSEQIYGTQFKDIADSLNNMSSDVILDGEIVVLDPKGKSDFQLMQNYQRHHQGALFYYVFDLLYLDGEDLRNLPLIERKSKLKELIETLNQPNIRFSDHIIEKGKFVFKEVRAKQLEGLIGKKISSLYQSRRSTDWVKIKAHQRQEVVIGGFTAPRGSREKFGALLVGIYDEDGKLNYCGHVGGGFDAALLTDIEKKLSLLIQAKCPFKNEPKPNSPVTWVKPKLVCEVAFAEWTNDQIMRQPIFQGLRTDKPTKAVVHEVPVSVETVKKSKKESETKTELTHLDKIYWLDEKYTKGDLVEYYESVAPFILPHLKGRPIMLHRFPNGIRGKDFYQKDLQNINLPEGITTCPVTHEVKIDNYLLIDNLQSLLYAVNLGSIDLHPFSSHYPQLNIPDFCVIDLDPHDIAFENVIEVALLLHEVLSDIKVKHHIKTSGGKGLHIIIPFNNGYTYDQSRDFAEIICHCIHKRFPSTTSLERTPSKRPKKIYLDCLQNRIGQTLVAPYSVRPRPKACVSTPLNWNEVNNKLDPAAFTIKTIPLRLKKKGDLLAPILKEKNDLKKALKLLESKGWI